MASKPLCVDLFCGLGGWAEGFLAEDYQVVGFDIERHEYMIPDMESVDDGGKGTKPVAKRGWTAGTAITLGMEGAKSQPRTKLAKYPGQLVIQDVLTLSGRQFRGANVIVASPPCQEYSWMAMPWSLAKKKAAWYREEYTRQLELNCLFNACFRIAHEAQVPLIVENVRGAQPWVGPARYNYGSFYLWGDVPALMPSSRREVMKLGVAHRSNGETNFHGSAGRKVPMNFHEHEKTSKPGRSFQSAAVMSSKPSARKAASAQIAKIPFPLANHIAKVFKHG